MENGIADYVGLVALAVGVGVAIWYFWGYIKSMNRMDK